VSTTPDQPEYLESGAGRPISPEPTGPGGGGGLKKGLLVGGGVTALALVGAAAWAAVSFFGTGAQPAEALPADTLGYVSIDLDPSGGQKIEALRTLNKFPAFEDEVGIDSDDDIRKKLFDEIEGELDCDDLDYAKDIEPWLGDRAAVAAVDTGDEQPSPVFVLQIKDADKAKDGIKAIADCAGEEVGSSIDGDWVILAEKDSIAEKVTEEAAKGSLADDDDFKKWTDEAGDSGVVAMYAGPALGDYLAENADDMFGFPLGMMTGVSSSVACVAPPVVDDSIDPDVDADLYDGCSDVVEPDFPTGESLISDEMKQQLEDFKGMAGVVRFDDGAIELEFAADGKAAGNSLLASDSAGDTISTLPKDTAAAIGVGFAEGWFGDLLEVYAPYIGGGEDVDSLLDEIETETGLALPDDIETLVGDSAALAIGSDFDPEAFVDSSDGSDVPIALKVDGDPDEIEAVLEKLRDQFPPDETAVFGSSSEGGTIVIGPNEDYRKEVLEDGDLGDDGVFKDVVREVDDASVVFFVNVDEIEKAIADALDEGDEEFLDNLEPISGFGISGWVDDDVSHSVTRLTTD
jgi:hypothetical protein